MKLNLSLSGKILSSVAIDPQNKNNDYYLKAFRRMLILRHRQSLAADQQPPVFCVEDDGKMKTTPLAACTTGEAKKLLSSVA